MRNKKVDFPSLSTATEKAYHKNICGNKKSGFMGTQEKLCNQDMCDQPPWHSKASRNWDVVWEREV